MHQQKKTDILNCLLAVGAGIVLGAYAMLMVPEMIEGFHEALKERYGEGNKMAEFPWGMLASGMSFMLLMAIDRLLISHSHSHGIQGGHEGSHHHPKEHSSMDHIMGGHGAAAGAAPASAVAAPSAAEEGKGATVVVVGAAAAGSSIELTAVSSPSAAEKQQQEKDTSGVAQQSEAASSSLVHDHDHGSSSLKKGILQSATLFILALSLHSILDGLSLGAEYDEEAFYGIVAAVVAHKLFDGLAAGAAVFGAGRALPFWQKLGLVVFASLMTPIGTIIGMTAVEKAGEEDASAGGHGHGGAPGMELVSSIIISISSGSFLFIGLQELLPTALEDGKWMAGKLACFVLGFAAMAILAGFI